MLTHAEEVRYPTYYHLLNMLVASQEHSDWQQCWQKCILNTMQSGKYIDYQQLALLWTMLFPAQERATQLATTILDHFNSHEQHPQRNAQRFISTVANDLRDLIITREVAEKTIQVIPISDNVQYTDLLIILLGRVLQIQEANEEGDAPGQEIQHIAQAAQENFLSAKAALDILRYLPVRSANEITFVIQLAQTTSNEHIQDACATSLLRVSTNTPEETDALQVGKMSSVQAIRDAMKYVEERIEQNETSLHPNS